MMTNKNHIHVYDAQGKQLCCTQEERIYTNAGAADLLSPKIKKEVQSHDGHDHDHDHDHDQDGATTWKKYLPAILSMLLLLAGIGLDYYYKDSFFNSYVRFIWYFIAYLPVGLPVLKEAIQTLMKGDFFTEFTLMCVATLGAFAIGEYPEGVAVMLFYAIGELFQSAAVSSAKKNIKALIDVRPKVAHVMRNGVFKTIDPDEVAINEIIQIKAGEKVALDGILLSESSNFNTSALTGESKPQNIKSQELVLAGMVNLGQVIEVKVTKMFSDSSLAKILEMVQHATARKAKTELLIRKFAKIYTPIVFFLAVALIVVPYFIVDNYDFSQWLYRALVFLVISCPCALVISIPLGYFGGIGAASSHGILFKGSNYLDLMTKVNTVVMDKTGTLTKGVFKVQEVVTKDYDRQEFMDLLTALEKKSTHPIAKALVNDQIENPNKYVAIEVEEISGYGMVGKVGGKTVLAGSTKLLAKEHIPYEKNLDQILETTVVVAIDNVYAGYVIIADELKSDAISAIAEMKKNGIKRIIMLSGDKDSITQHFAEKLGIDEAHGDLLPEQKVQHLEKLRTDRDNVIAFIGDGINDAPVLALSDVGIAMGAMGSDLAIETADVIIQNDQPSKVSQAIKIGKATRKIVIQNISLAFGVKVLVLILGAGGLATMWEAVFADVGVALLAILNAVRIQKMNF